jgi:hypothetical protein
LNFLRSAFGLIGSAAMTSPRCLFCGDDIADNLGHEREQLDQRDTSFGDYRTKKP